MTFDYTDKFSRLLIFLVALAVLYGCGGSGGSDSRTTPMSLTINWPDRGRAVSPPSSALSARIVIRAARPDGTDLEFVANRNDDGAAHPQTYTSTEVGVAGLRTIEARFYASREGTGSLVGQATFSSQIGSNGQIETNISVDSRIHEVQVVSGQHVMFHRQKALTATALDAQHNAIVVGPDAFKWSVASGNDHLQFDQGKAEGLLVGEADVTASVDNVTSPSVPVDVVPNSEYITVPATLLGISGDGSTLVGTTLNQESTAYVPMRWTKEGGLQRFNYAGSEGVYAAAYATNHNGAKFVGSSIEGGAQMQGWTSDGADLSFVSPQVAGTSLFLIGLSADGSTALGGQTVDGISRAFTMQAGQTPVLLDLLPSSTQSKPDSISDDGTRVLGSMMVDGHWRAALWVNGVPQLVPVSGDSDSFGSSLSGDGLVVFGYWGTAGWPTAHFRWSAADGVQTIPFHLNNLIGGCSYAGDLAVNDTHVWSATNGVEALGAYVARVTGLSLSGQNLDRGFGCSADGKTLFGSSGWIIRPLPEE